MGQIRDIPGNPGRVATLVRDRCSTGGAENASTGKRKYGKGKYETAHFARMENASTENASTLQTFSQIKKVWYFTS